MGSVFENLSDVRHRMAKKAKSCGRDPESIELVAVSKRQSQQRVLSALEAGQRVFGENRVQEALSRWTDLKKSYPDVNLHLIGPLQTNKAKDAVALFDVIETLDRRNLVDALAKEMERQGRRLPCLIQVNTGEEPQKSGILPRDLPDFLSFCRAKGLNICGLMCIPPVDEPPALHFAFLKKLAVRHGLKYLSMGMSNDFEKAIACGATHIRVGSALFGERE